MNVTLRSGKVLDGPSINEVGESSRKHAREEEEEEEEGKTNEPYKPNKEDGKVEEEEDEERKNKKEEELEQAEKEKECEERKPEPVEVACKEKEDDNREVPNETNKKRGNLSPRHEKGPEKKKKREKGKIPTEAELNEKLDRQLKPNWNYPDQRPLPPYPTSPKDSNQYKGFMQLLKDIVLNISMYDLLCGVPKYGKYIRDMLRGKGRGKLDGIVTVSKACSCYIKRDLTLLKKESDPGVPTIPVDIERRRFTRALYDLGSGVSLMPLSIAKALSLEKELKYTPLMLQLADKSLVKPEEIIEDVLVQVD